MLDKLISHHHYTLVQNWLLVIGSGSWIGWTILKEVSSACAIVLPITGVISFFLFIVVNYKRILQGFKDIFTSIKN